MTSKRASTLFGTFHNTVVTSRLDLGEAHSILDAIHHLNATFFTEDGIHETISREGQENTTNVLVLNWKITCFIYYCFKLGNTTAMHTLGSNGLIRS